MSHKSSRAAFTLIELLVVISIIALLIGLLLPALRMARQSCLSVRAVSNTRQLMIAHTAYQQDYQGHVPWGYTPMEKINGQDVTAHLSSGHTVSGYWARRYPLRMLGYLGEQWPLLWDHADELPELPTAADSPFMAGVKATSLSTNTAYGINSVFVGGDADSGGFLPPGATDGRPNYGRHAVFYGHEARRPSSLIVFTEATEYRVNEVHDGVGFHRVSPPQAQVNRWRAEGDRFVVEDTAGTFGLPQGRYLRRTSVAFLDGHAAAMTADALDDMRLWANRAEATDYDYTQ